ncbi:DNA repair protein RAD9 [Fonsecaea pedrosoi]|nr:DNA repair protein RAD9 [Fonsecaea pedrosoi]
MATDSLLSIDFANLKADILAPLESGQEQPDSEHTLHTTVQISAESVVQLTLHDTESASVPQLPSTVPESQLILTNAESQLQFLPPAPVSNKAEATSQKMTSQGSDAPTQELSPSDYEPLLNRSRSARQLQDPEYGLELDQGFEEETGATLHEGDEGHIDLISSLASQKEPGSEGEDEHSGSPPIDFSPSKSPRALTQFPESQRFKTPATVGRKRRYNGDVVDSPELPRNPLLRGGEAQAQVMGLSQAFAATQANTSPFVGNPNGDLPSDRPSPNIELQPRPMTAATSSPLRPMSDFKRASTEPASRYVSIQQSQALREQARRRQLEMLNEDEDSDRDSFEDDADSFLDRERRRRERDRKIQAQLSSISKQSMRSVSLSKSSPIPGPIRSPPSRTPALDQPRNQSDSSPIKRNRYISAHESEEETEQEDNTSVVVTRSSQPIELVDDEDKENFSDRASQIPETTARLHRIMSDIPTHVQDSPLLRHGLETHSHPIAFNGSQLFAVADSQPERPTRQRQTTTQVPRSSATDGVLDFVPQSPALSAGGPFSTNQKDTASALPLNPSSAVADEPLSPDEEPSAIVVDHAELSSTPRTLQPATSTVPETSSNEQQIQSERQSEPKPQSRDTESNDAFDTAPTHKQTSTVAFEEPAATELSSPPIVTTPPGKRRLRMAEIAAEPSPLRSQVSFNAIEALQLDADFQNPSPKRSNFEESSGAALSPVGRASGRQQRNIANNTNKASSPSSDQNELDHPEPESGDGRSEQSVRAVSPVSTYSRRERRPTAKVLSASSTRPRHMNSTARASAWDLQDSPPQKAVPLIKSSTGVKRKARDAGALEEGHSTLNKKLKVVKIPAPAPPLPDRIEGQQNMLDPLRLHRSANLSAALAPPADVEAADDSSERNIAPNMVFACFIGKTRAYHPAICLGRPNSDSSRFLIQWEGYEPDEVDESGVRSLDLRIGDQVKIDMRGFPKVSHIIRGFDDKIVQGNSPTNGTMVTDIRGYQTILVAPKQAKRLLTEASAETVKKVPVSAVYLDSIMWGQMKDRIYEYKPSVHAVLSSGISTPLDRASTPSTPSSRTRRGITGTGSFAAQITEPTKGLLSKMAFAISYEDSSRRGYLVDLVQTHGGIVLRESFLDLFEPDSMQLKDEFSGFSFAALLTDRHSRKEKYLQALALGLPCLSGRWIEVCVESDQVVDWASYLLPAGESAELEGATKSRILPFSASADGLRVIDIIGLRPKIFRESQVIVVMGKGKAEVKRRPYLSLVRALDPAKVELETDLTAAKMRLEATLDECETPKYIFVDDREVEAAQVAFLTPSSSKRVSQPQRGRKRSKRQHEYAQEDDDDRNATPETSHPGIKIKVMCNEDIVQSLILGKLRIG